MSRARLHVFVEGRVLDAFVYGALCSRECPGDFEYEIIRADQIPNYTKGGKVTLLAHFQKMRRAKRLVEDFKGIRHGVIFFADKDIDDVKRTKRRSPHLMYTPTYDIEAQVYEEGDLAEAVAATISLDPRVAQHDVSNPTDWREYARNLWRDWVELCMLSQMAGAKGVVNYSVSSQVNPSPGAAADQSLVAHHRTKIQSASQLTSHSFANLEARIARLVSRAYASGDEFRFFKGKWYPIVFEDLLRQLHPVELNRVQGFREHLTSHVAQTVDFDAAWAAPYRTRIAAVLAAVAAPGATP